VFKALLPALAIFAVAWSACGATPAKSAKKHHRAATAAHAPAKKGAKPATAKAAGKSAAGKTTKTAALRKGKSARHPSRSRQQAPSPERYKEIQQALASKGFFQGEPTGEWGPDSVDSLKRFQTAQSLTPDGRIGSLSLIALGLGPKRLTAKSDSTPPPAGTLPTPAPPQ
jgi:peptidoglycan hydrolase-like protein with peptidoglycan-binding domain